MPPGLTQPSCARPASSCLWPFSELGQELPSSNFVPKWASPFWGGGGCEALTHACQPGPSKACPLPGPKLSGFAASLTSVPPCRLEKQDLNLLLWLRTQRHGLSTLPLPQSSLPPHGRILKGKQAVTHLVRPSTQSRKAGGQQRPEQQSHQAAEEGAAGAKRLC